MSLVSNNRALVYTTREDPYYAKLNIGGPNLSKGTALSVGKQGVLSMLIMMCMMLGIIKKSVKTKMSIYNEGATVSITVELQCLEH